MHKFLESYSQPVHGWEIQGFPMCLFEILVVAFDMKDSMTFVWKKDSYTFHTLHWWNLKDLEEVDLTHCIRGINVGFIWRVTELSLYTHLLKTGWQWVLIVWRHPSLSSSIWLSNGSNTWTNSSKVVVFILSTMCEIIFTSKR